MILLNMYRLVNKDSQVGKEINPTTESVQSMSIEQETKILNTVIDL